jgi:hypothetical protein
VATIEKIRRGCFIYLPYHAAPKYISLSERSFDLEEIPTYFYVLLFLHEDDQFLMHNGFNLSEIKRAFLDCLFKRRIRGGSSITQQTSKLLFTNGKFTLKRKYIETIGSIALEKNLDKEEILYLYLSTLKLVSIVSGLPDIFKYLIEKVDLRNITIDEAELVISLFPAPTRRITQIKKFGVKAFNFNYSYEKLLNLIRILDRKHILENDLGLREHIDKIKVETDARGKNVKASSSGQEEIDLIARASMFMNKIQDSINKIALRNLPSISPRYLLTKWQLGFVELLNDNPSSIMFNLSQKEEGRIIDLARKNNLLTFLSESKAKDWKLNSLLEAIRIGKISKKNDFELDSDMKDLISTLSGDEISVEAFLAPNFGNLIERLFSIS